MTQLEASASRAPKLHSDDTACSDQKTRIRRSEVRGQIVQRSESEAETEHQDRERGSPSSVIRPLAHRLAHRWRRQTLCAGSGGGVHFGRAYHLTLLAATT